MNQKNSLNIDLCFKDLDNPIELFEEWFNEAKKSEINDPNAIALATVGDDGLPMKSRLHGELPKLFQLMELN